MTTEKRLIDANALKANFVVLGEFANDLWHVGTVRIAIDNAPTVDAVPVVRCKDCKKWNRSNGSCEEFTSHRLPAGGRITFLTREDDFCS